MRILGVHDGHNASAALVEDGRVVAAIQEERLTRTKNEFGFPHGAVRWVLEYAGIGPSDLDHVAVASNHNPVPWTREDLLNQFAEWQTTKFAVRQALKRTPLRWVQTRRRQIRRAARLEQIRGAGLPVDAVTWVDHHTAHAAAAYYGSPLRDHKVLVLTMDGEGDDLCATVRVGERGRLAPPIATVHHSHSLGGIYAVMTYLFGMVPLEHEYKLMGLAPYAPQAGAARSYEVFKTLFEFDDAGGLTWKRAHGVPHAFNSYRYLRRRLERHRFDWVAAGLQRFTEEHLVSWVRNAISKTGIHHVALGGGVFMNVKANKLIYELPEVEELFVFPSCGDETNSLGAAFQIQAIQSQAAGHGPDTPPLQDMYWGPEPDAAEAKSLTQQLQSKGLHVERPTDIEDRVAELLAAGHVVARAAGRMEFGARALGNRSILADPKRVELVRIINDMVKSRDFWMPFAPAMLAESHPVYVVNPKGMDAPYMIMSFATTEEVRAFPAAVHPYDETARPQFVHSEHNAGFHRILSRFEARTGRSVLLNTSFNLHGHPIVCSAQDAVQVLESSGLPHLALGEFLISKSQPPETTSTRPTE